MLPIMPQPIIPSPQLTFFDKFKNPDSFRRSAFRLCHPASPQSEQPSTPKKSSIIRKHRGNYRKYTVGEKEQAVKQVHAFIFRSLKESTPRKSLKNTVFPAVTCYGGRKTAVRGKKEVVVQLMERCNSLSTQKLMAKYWSRRRKFELRRKG